MKNKHNLLQITTYIRLKALNVEFWPTKAINSHKIYREILCS